MFAETELFDVFHNFSDTRGQCFPELFRWHDAEPLLEQALLMLTQAEAARQLWWSAGREYSRLKLELLRDNRVQEIADDEETAGRFRTSVETAESALAGEIRSLSEIDEAIQKASEVMQLLDPNGADARQSIERDVYLNTIRSLYLALYDAQSRPKEMIKTFPEATWARPGDQGQMLYRVDQRETARQSESSFTIAFRSAQRDAHALAANRATSESRVDVLKKQLRWDQANQSFQARRLSVDREVLAEKRD